MRLTAKSARNAPNRTVKVTSAIVNGQDQQPVARDEFATLMGPFGPFEAKPHLAVACSGGPDSMALTFLLKDWADTIDGSVSALIVDHGIRSESGLEAKTVAARLPQHDIRAEILTYSGPPFTKMLQATARQARYNLLSEWCARNAVLSLFVAHHQEDQAETVLLRLARGSGLDGLAAMAPVVETRQLRILRPLLTVPAKRLRATLKDRGAEFVQDPSNKDPNYARVRMRALSETLGREGMTARRLAATAVHAARARSTVEGGVAQLLAHAALVYPQGYASLEKLALQKAPEEIALRAMARMLTTIGGNDYSPRMERLLRLYDWMISNPGKGGKTLSGCRILAQDGTFLVCREPAAADEIAFARGEVFWDGRFRFLFRPRGQGEVRRLGREGWCKTVADAPNLRNSPIPAAVKVSLPAIWSEKEVVCVPHLGYFRDKEKNAASFRHTVCFAPRQPLVPARFTLQKGEYTLSV